MAEEEKCDYVNGSSEETTMHSIPDAEHSSDDEEQADDAYAEGQYSNRICKTNHFVPIDSLPSFGITLIIITHQSKR